MPDRKSFIYVLCGAVGVGLIVGILRLMRTLGVEAAYCSACEWAAATSAVVVFLALAAWWYTSTSEARARRRLIFMLATFAGSCTAKAAFGDKIQEGGHGAGG